MTKRKKKLLLTQIFLIIFSLIIIFYTYNYKNKNTNEEIISKSLQKKIEKNLSDDNENSDVFFNIEYSGIDLSGNRFMLKSKEARTDKETEN